MSASKPRTIEEQKIYSEVYAEVSEKINEIKGIKRLNAIRMQAVQDAKQDNMSFMEKLSQPVNQTIKGSKIFMDKLAEATKGLPHVDLISKPKKQTKLKQRDNDDDLLKKMVYGETE